MLKALFAIGAVQVMAMVVLLVRTKVLALFLGPELVGILAVIDKVVAVLVQTASLSLPFAAIRFLPSIWEADRREFFTRLRAMSLTLVSLSLLATVVGLTVTSIDPAGWGAELLPYRIPLFVAFLTIPVQALVPFVQNATAVAFGPHRSMLFYLGHALVLALSAVIGAWWSGLSGIYALYAGSGIVLVGVMLVRLNSPADRSIRLPRLARNSFRIPREVWRFGLALFALAFLAPYAALFVHYRVLSELGPEAAGWMQAAMGISLAVRTVLGAAHPILLTPNVNRGGTPHARMSWAIQFQTSLCLLTGLVLPPLLLFPTAAVELLYTAAFRPGADFVFLFVLVEIVTLLAATYQAIILSLDRLGFHVAQNVAAQVIAIAVGWTAIPALGISGAAIAGLSAQIFLYAGTTLFLSRSFSLALPARAWLLSLYLITMLLLAGLAGRIPADGNWASALMRFALYVVIVGGLVPFLTPEEFLRVRKFVRSISDRV